MLTRAVLALLSLFSFVSLAHSQPASDAAAPPGWLTSPYKLDIHLHIQDHPLFTPLFKDQMQRELIDALKRDLGKIADVVAEGHNWMEHIVKQGWSYLDGRQVPLDERKHHFVRVFYQDGQYEVQARQVDGVTGYVSTLRKARTADRIWVSRIAALMVAQDFGITGRVTEVNGNSIRLQLKGVGVEPPPSVRVLGREVFYVFSVRPGSDGKPVGERVAETVLVVTGSQTDACQTRLISFYKNPISLRDRNTEYRAIKLGTQNLPLQIRIVDKKTGQPLSGHGVAVSSDGFERMTEIGSTDSFGRVRSKEAFHNVVCVRITYGGRTRLIAPVALLDDQPVEKALAGTQEADDFDRFDSNYRKWQMSASRLGAALEGEFVKINEAINAGNTSKAVENAKEQSPKLAEELDRLRKELESMRNEAQNIKGADREIKTGERYVTMIADTIKKLDEFIQEQVNPTSAQTKYAQGRIKDDAFEIEAALKLYEEALELDEADKKISVEKRKHVDQLKKEWNAIKGDDHQAARDFIFKQWEKVEMEDLDKFLPDAEKHLRACVRSGDRLGVEKLNKVNLMHNDRIVAAMNRLADVNSDEAAEKYEGLKATRETLRGVYVKAAEFLQKTQR